MFEDMHRSMSRRGCLRISITYSIRWRGQYSPAYYYSAIFHGEVCCCWCGLVQDRLFSSSSRMAAPDQAASLLACETPAGYVFTNQVKEFSYHCKVGQGDQCSLRTRRPSKNNKSCESEDVRILHCERWLESVIVAHC